MGDDSLRAAIAALAAAGQEHLAAHARTLPEAEGRRFLLEAAAQPWEALREALTNPPRTSPELRPPQALTWRRQMGEGGLRPRLARLGRGLLAGGRVATLLLAGGQGTRLGHPGPKGTVVFGPEDDRTLYRIHGERILAVSRRAGRPVPLIVLVSPSTEAATRAAFADAGRWGLAEDQVQFLVQGELPCLDPEGRALIAAPGRLATAPDGHGGAYEALARAGVLETLRSDGVDVLTTFQVDNPLSLPLDPVMLGWMVERRLQAIGKGVRKRTSDEKVGVFARDLKGRLRVIEYSEMPDPSSRPPAQFGGPTEATPDLGSIAIHGFSVQWLCALAERGLHLPLHAARKPVPHLDESGARVEPADANGVKLERFVFDLFPEARRAEVHEVDREREFAPVKNARGTDSLEEARTRVASEVARLHEACGEPVPAAPSLRPLELGEDPALD